MGNENIFTREFGPGKLTVEFEGGQRLSVDGPGSIGLLISNAACVLGMFGAGQAVIANVAGDSPYELISFDEASSHIKVRRK